jgi:hypothetical protein
MSRAEECGESSFPERPTVIFARGMDLRGTREEGFRMESRRNLRVDTQGTGKILSILWTSFFKTSSRMIRPITHHVAAH